MPPKVASKKNDPHEDEISENIYAREVIGDRLSRFVKFLDGDIGDIFQVEVRLKSVQDDFADFDKIQTRLEYLVPAEKENRLDTESRFYSVISNAKRLISDQEKMTENEDVSVQNIENLIPFKLSAAAKLPELGLPSFNGKYETWYSFKDIFQSVVHDRNDLSEIDKFLYLKLCCKEDASRLVDSLDVTADNYTIALELLQKRYENKRAIINHHVNHILFNLPSVAKESPGQLRHLLDSIHQHKSALKKLNLPVDHWDTLLIPIILPKLDYHTKREWENKQIDQNLPTLNQLTDFLTKKCFSLEAINHDSKAGSRGYSRDYQSSKSYDKDSTQDSYMKKVTHSVTYHNDKMTCYICNEHHFIYHCPKFTNLSLSEKYNEIRKQKLCSNCLRPGHSKPDCMSSGCKKCGFKHNTALHVDQHQNYHQNSNPRTFNNSYNNASTSTGNQRNNFPKPIPRMETSTSARVQQLPHHGGKNDNPRSAMCVIDRDIEARSEFQNEIGINHVDENSSSETKNVTYSYSIFDTSQVLLSTATILIQGHNGKWFTCNALLDSGSQSNLISESLCQKLQLKYEKISIPLSGINQIETKITNRTYARIKSRIGTFQRNLSFLVLSVITEKLPIVGFRKSILQFPREVDLADEQFNVPKHIDLLLGAGIFYDLLGNGRIRLGDNMPVLQETYFGWIFSGPLISNESRNRKTICNLSTKISNKELNDSLNKFWQIEEFENKLLFSKDEQFCEEHFKENTKRHDDGRFIVKYPFKQTFDNELGNSKNMALKRFQNLETRLNKNEDLKQQYIEFMNEYETLEHMTFKCNLEADDSIENSSFFLPHTAVLRDSITTRCRVVFDASAKSSTGISLNDKILAGPTIQENLFSILLRLRLRKYVLNADVKMMYRCILIDQNEREFQKILWRSKPNESIKVYELNTVTYGTSSAPFQATRCLKELALQNRLRYPRTSKIIETSFYMDDLLTSVDSEQEAKDIYHEITEIFTEAKFELRKWSSNNTEILNYIMDTSDSKDDKLILFHNEKDFKTLGITWNANSDILKYSINLKDNGNKITKRTVLSIISQIFDPLGLVGPAIIKAKLLVQQLWHLKLDWDQEIPSHLKEIWVDFISQIHYLEYININRHVLIENAEVIELYGFGDSSEKAYGACIYLCSINKDKKRDIRLLTAKSKVAPIKKQSLPRLELLAALLLAELVLKIKKTLDISISKTIYFTDSTIVLDWLKIEPCNLETFVGNRIAKITEISDVRNWRHVKSKDNAADIISRGLGPKELSQSEMWFKGPSFLADYTNHYDNEITNNIENLPGIKKTKVVLKITEVLNDFKLFELYSNLEKLRTVVAYIYRFINRLSKGIAFESKNLTPKELNDALSKLIKIAQQESFEQEISDLKKSKNVNNHSKILNLHPFLDSNNILRVGGRLSNAQIEFDQQHPIILPYKHNLTKLIISEEHGKYLHAGAQNLLAIIRLKYWPVNGKNMVKQTIRSCVRCYRVNPKTSNFLMGELPRTRVTPSRPFTNCGVDYAGPIQVKEGTLRRSKLVKTYICIFICFATRAVHIELVNDLGTNSFLNALKRFCSRRGKPANIHSDNGLNFVGANNYFIELYNLLNDEKHNDAVFSFLANEEINWHFIPARSAHIGGLWEAAVKSTKFHLKRILGDASLNFEEMYTLLVQIEACLNSRPLIPISNDPNDYIPLTPSHFLIGDSLASSPEEDVKDLKVSRLSRYQRLQQVYQQFWNRWSREYLSNLQIRTKWKNDAGNVVKVGALVVLVEDNMPPLRWPMARVTELYKGADDIVRVVSVRIANGNVLKRSLSKICVLPIKDNEL